MSFTVIIPSRDVGNLRACLLALREREPDCKVIVVDDGLELPEGMWQPEPRCALIAGRKPFVFARNCNLGIAAAGTDDVVLLNDDALLDTPGGLTALALECREHPEYGLIAATTNVTGQPLQWRGSVGLREVRNVAFVCAYIPRATIDRVGLLDEQFTTYGWEDNDYCRRVRMAGLKVGVYDHCYVDHGSLRSTFRGAPLAPGPIDEGRRIYQRKWGDLR